jgi:parallel beta-helix repeat protein
MSPKQAGSKTVPAKTKTPAQTGARQEASRCNGQKHMKPTSITRRRLLVGLGFLGVTGILYNPVYRYLEARSMTRDWEEKWQKASATPPDQDEISPPANASRLPPGIDKDLILTRKGSPWFIDTNLTIPAGVTLTLEAGTQLFIKRNHYIRVNGRILAKGEPGNPVSLRGNSMDEADKWAGIFVINTDTPSVFRHVDFENCYYGARIVLASAEWHACAFMNVREICSSYKSDTTFHACLVDYKNYPGSGNINVFKFHKGVALMEGCRIHCPDSDYKVDGIDADYLIRGVFRGNRLYGGACPGADAIDVGRRSHNILIEGNIITDFVDKGISVGEKAEVTVNNNIISGCAMGIGVKDSARARVSRTTFYGNDFAAECYEKVVGQGGGHAELENCIIVDCKIAPYKVDDNSSIDFTRTLCDQQLLPGDNNLHGTPAFEDVAGGLFNCTGITMADGSMRECGMLGASINHTRTGSREERQTTEPGRI